MDNTITVIISDTLFLCLRSNLFICVFHYYLANAWARNYQGQNLMNPWPNFSGMQSYGQPGATQQYGFGYGQPTYTQKSTVETQFTNTE